MRWTCFYLFFPLLASCSIFGLVCSRSPGCWECGVHGTWCMAGTRRGRSVKSNSGPCLGFALFVEVVLWRGLDGGRGEGINTALHSKSSFGMSWLPMGCGGRRFPLVSLSAESGSCCLEVSAANEVTLLFPFFLFFLLLSFFVCSFVLSLRCCPANLLCSGMLVIASFPYR